VNEEEAVRRYPTAAKAIKEMIAAGTVLDADKAAATDEPLCILAGDRTTIPGSRQTKCGCGRLVWLSPDTLSMMEKRGSKPILICCATCVAKLAEDSNGTN
jgi:hypothetical protein